MRRRALAYRHAASGRDYEFAYATHKVVASALYAAQVRNTDDDSTADVGFSSDVINTAAITTHANGFEARFNKLYDQSGRLTELAHPDPSLEPIATDGSYNGLAYLKDYTDFAGLYYQAENLDINFAEDWIVQYIFKNETRVLNDRSNIVIRTNLSGLEGNFVMGMRPTGSNYLINCIHNYSESDKLGEVSYLIPKGDTTTTFTLYTFSKIGGTFKFHRNNVEQTSGATAENIGGGYLKGVYVGLGYSSTPTDGNVAGGKINDFKGLLMKSGDLSSFNLSTYNTEIMDLFDI